LKKILIIGANGFLGTNILSLKDPNHKFNNELVFIAADIHNSLIPQNIIFHNIDITNYYNTYKKIRKINPDVIILTAAMTDVDQCEISKKLATKINFNGPINVLKAVKKVNSKLLFISTDFVFDGEKKNGGYKEDELPNPLSFYAKTKYDAEIAIINYDIDYLICRTAVLYGWFKYKLNYITWIINKLQSREKVSIVTSQINSPTYVINLAEILLKLIQKDGQGIYHTAGNGFYNRYDIAIKCAEIFNFDKDLITPIEKIEQKAIRPKNVGLDISKLKKFLKLELNVFNLDDGLKHMKNNLMYI